MLFFHGCLWSDAWGRFSPLQTPTRVSKVWLPTVAGDASNRGGPAAGPQPRAPFVRAGHRAGVSFARVVGPVQSFVSANPPADDKARGPLRPFSPLDFGSCPGSCVSILQSAIISRPPSPPSARRRPLNRQPGVSSRIRPVSACRQRRCCLPAARPVEFSGAFPSPPRRCRWR